MYVAGGCLFSTHAPIRGATCGIRRAPMRRDFNSRTHKGRDGLFAHGVLAFCNFNSRTSYEVRCIWVTVWIAVCHIISTHAPTRGATYAGKKASVLIVISTHAPIEGAMKSTKRADMTQEISTHAPIRGATPSLLLMVRGTLHFNSRTHKGCDAQQYG